MLAKFRGPISLSQFVRLRNRICGGFLLSRLTSKRLQPAFAGDFVETLFLSAGPSGAKNARLNLPPSVVY